MSTMDRLVLVARHGYVGTFQWTPWRYWIANVVLRPVLFLAVFGVIRGELEVGDARNLVIGLCAYDVAVTLITFTNHSIRNDVIDGTLTIALTTPMAPPTIWMTRALAHIPNAAATGVAAVLFAALAFDLDLGSAGVGSLVAAAALILSATALALLAGVLTAQLREWVGPVGLTTGVLLTLSGVVIPRSELPIALETLSAFVPLSHAIDALRASFGGPSDRIWVDIASELAVAAGFLIAAMGTFSLWLRRARASGSLIVEGT